MKLQTALCAPEDADAERLDQVRGLLQGIDRLLDLASALARSGRRIELTGIDRRVGLLCAQALDLPQELGRSLIPGIEAQIRLLDNLSALLRHQAHGHPTRENPALCQVPRSLRS